MASELLSFDNVVIFKKTKNYQPDACKHKQVIFDDELSTIECKDCGKQLNPVKWYADHYSALKKWHDRISRRHAELLVIEEKIRKTGIYACQHCHEISKINISALASRAAVERKMKVLDDELRTD